MLAGSQPAYVPCATLGVSPPRDTNEGINQGSTSVEIHSAPHGVLLLTFVGAIGMSVRDQSKSFAGPLAAVGWRSIAAAVGANASTLTCRYSQGRLPVDITRIGRTVAMTQDQLRRLKSVLAEEGEQ